ncbi:MAG: ATP-dependent Clp protease proteolytic subunit [Proteobacteria bacterium]|nr:ATP-dependent Clp protease proteolytic subunit [Pseudomonadota bacterium]MDA0951266.1 ATP-dependent Clp protease proteolytic subunit [Pseudomonadota bacterium]MDA1071047.1 ATP-dependent Clp protease proteolytic subunit [Pseudomonadota bacterium]
MTLQDLRIVADDEDDEKDKDKAEAAKKEEKNRAVQKILFDSRTILLFGEINEKAARETISQLLAMGEESRDPIRMVISSPGGHVESGDAIHDMIRFVVAPVKVIGTGWVASAGAHIYLAAAKENRYCTPNTRFLLHQPMGGVGGKATEIDIEAKEILKMRDRLNHVIAQETGQPIERVAKDTDRNHWMGPEEAKDYGMVAHIIDTFDEVK